MWGRTWREQLLDLLLPETCASCREDLPVPMHGPVCGPCLSTVRPAGLPGCPRCSSPRSHFPPDCPLSNSDILALRAVFAYRPPLPSLIHAFKYRYRRKVGTLLGSWMGGAWNRHRALGAPHAFVPVPLHPRRERERGFNQARELACAVSRLAGAPVFEALKRDRNTPSQAKRARRSRAGLLAGAFSARAPQSLKGARIVLVDDVYTTGETLRECAAALHRAGAADIRAFVLCRGEII